MNKETIIRTRKYLKPFYKDNIFNFTMAFISTIFISIFMLAISYTLQEVIDASTKGLADDLTRIFFLTCLMLIFFSLSYVLRNYFLPKYVCRANRQYKKYAFSNILKHDIVSFSSKGASEYISALTNDLNTIETGYIENIFTLFMNALLLVGSITMMFLYNWLLTIVALILSLLPFLVTLIFGKRLVRCQENVANKNASFLHYSSDILQGFSVIKSFKAEKKIAMMFEKENDDLEVTKMKRRVTVDYITLLTSLTSIIAQFGVFFVGAFLCIRGENVTAGVMIIFVQLMNYVVSPLGEIPKIISMRRSCLPLIDKMAMLCEYEKHDNKEKVTFNDNLILNQVFFSFEEKPILKNISFCFEKNKAYAIVGPSGSGKSTLTNILKGMYLNYQGEVLYDGKNLKDLDVSSMYDLISVIEQNVFIFNSSIIDNITMYADFPKTKIEEVIVNSGLDKLIKEKGINYVCGDGGNNLSGGEAQRVSIARSLLRNAQMLIVDEATSALDNETSAAINNVIIDLKNTTKIVITHRLEEQILKKFDEIIVLKDGSICETGDFDTLMNKNGIFKSMYQIGQ